MRPFMPRALWLGASALLATSGLQPVLVAPTLAAEVSLQRSIATEQQQQRQRFTGVWALTDNANNLFNVRLSADGSAGQPARTAASPASISASASTWCPAPRPTISA